MLIVLARTEKACCRDLWVDRALALLGLCQVRFRLAIEHAVKQASSLRIISYHKIVTDNIVFGKDLLLLWGEARVDLFLKNDDA